MSEKPSLETPAGRLKGPVAHYRKVLAKASYEEQVRGLYEALPKLDVWKTASLITDLCARVVELEDKLAEAERQMTTTE